MAWTPDGFWTPETSDAAKQVAAVGATNSPLMRQAAGQGVSQANRRGLANSSLAVGASQAEMLKASVPIGLQNSAQIHAKNLAALNANENMRYGTTLQQMQDVSAKDRLGMQIASTEKLSANEITARMAELDKSIASNMALAKQGDNAAMERLQAELGSRAALQSQQLAMQERLTGMELSSREKISASEIASNEKLTSMEIAARMSEIDKRIAGDMALAQQGDAAAMARLQTDLAARQELTAMEIGSAELIEGNRIASNEKLATMEIQSRIAELDKRIEADMALAAQGDAAAMERLKVDNASRAELAQMDIEGRKDLQSMADSGALLRQREELAARTDIAEADREAEMTRLDKQLAQQTFGELQAFERLKAELSNRTDLAAADRDAELARLDTEIASRMVMLEKELASDLERVNIDKDTRLSIAELDAALQSERNATDALISSNNAYMAALGQSMLNENIPADVRAAYQASLKAATDASIKLAGSANGIPMDWGGSGANAPVDQYGNNITTGPNGEFYYTGGSPGGGGVFPTPGINT